MGPDPDFNPGAVYRPSELQAFLQSLGIHPKKGLSQNFLIDGNIVRKILATAAVAPGDIVLEVGPGPGALTQALLEAGAHVIAVEMDAVLAKALERFRGPTHSLEIITSDILKVSLDEIVGPKLVTGKKAKVIANLPYHVTTPIITRMVPRNDLFQSITVMVQKEVADRMTSPCGNRVYGSLTVFLEFYSTPTYAFTVGKNCFLPPPKIDSAVVHLDMHVPTSVTDHEGFFRLTRTAFEHRRKMLRASLRDLYSSETVTHALEKLQMNPLARPEDLSLSDFVRLFEVLQS